MSSYGVVMIDRWGGPNVLRYESRHALPEPEPGEVRVRVEAAGVGYTDTILRRGRYVAYKGGLPVTPGYDMAGMVDALGPGVAGLAAGDRVCDMPVFGSYSGYMLRPAGSLIPVPDGVDAVTAVDVPLMATTAWQMLTRIVPLRKGQPVLIVGASGAVGRPLVRLARHLGLKVVGTASAAKLPLVEELGASAIDYARPDLAAAIRAVSGGGVAAAFDAIGGRSWETSWSVLAHGGVLLGYGSFDFLESGAPSSVAREMFARFFGWNESGKTDGTGRSATMYDISQRRGALPDEYRADAMTLLAMIGTRAYVPLAAEVLPLSDAAEAHRRVASGRLVRRLVLKPDHLTSP